MRNLRRLSKTGIEYGDYAWNFASGCGNNINGKCKAGGFKCWAYSISQRFEEHYPNGFKPAIYPDALTSPFYLKKPSRILCAFMGDLFWDCSEFNPEQNAQSLFPCLDEPETLKHILFDVIEHCPQHTFIFLTKQPQNLIKWSPFPDNCYVGVTATNRAMLSSALFDLNKIEAKVKYISIEPFLSRMCFEYEEWKGEVQQITVDNSLPKGFDELSWVIIGSQTGPYKPPKIEWVKEIVEACDKAGVPVFLKNNLRPLISKLTIDDKWVWAKDIGYGGLYRQEFPK